MPKIPPRKLPLCGPDLENLRASGLTDETIRANKLFTENDEVKLATILNRLPVRPPKEIPYFCRDGGLVIPYFDLQEKNGFNRVRPHAPRVRDGEPIKYEHPVGAPLRAFIPKSSRAKLRDGESEIHLTEGEKKALCLDQHGYCAIGISGVWCWKKKGGDELIDDLAAIPWKGRIAYITFDYDKKSKTRQNVGLAAKRLARALRKAGAKEVYIVELPPRSDGDKQGVDDFLVAHGADAYCELVRKAQPAPIIPDFQPLTKAEGRTDANNAIRLVDKYRGDIRWVGNWGKWLLWDEQRWKIDRTLTIAAYAKVIAATLFVEIAALLREDKE